MTIPFVKARWFTNVTAKRRIDFIVLHDMEAPEKSTTAEAVARYFATTSSKTSCHYCVDSDSIVQCVAENDIAYHAPPNTHSIGIEHAGYARQTRAQWLDPFGVKMLRLSAGLCRELCEKYDVPKDFLTAYDLRAGKRGITTHANVSKAFGQSTHTDPGANFPIDYYMKLVRGDDDEMELTDRIAIPQAIATELGSRTSYTVSDLIRGAWIEAKRGARDAAIARKLAEAAALAGKPLTAEETEAVIEKVLAEDVLKVDISVAGTEV